MRTWEESRRRDLEIFERLHRRVRVVMESVTGLVAGAVEVSDALQVFIARNPDFEEMPAGARLLGAIERQTAKACEVDRSFRRFRTDLVGEKESTKNSASVRV